MGVKSQLWYGEVPGIFRYGISALGYSKEEVMVALKKGYQGWMRQFSEVERNNLRWNGFEEAFEYFGSFIDKVKVGKPYHEGLKE